MVPTACMDEMIHHCLSLLSVFMRDSPRPIHRPSSSPPRHIFLLARAFFRKGEKAAAATANLRGRVQECRASA